MGGTLHILSTYFKTALVVKTVTISVEFEILEARIEFDIEFFT